ncbi:MAG TPA: N-6 DNA methylase [Tepidisphaeraceae bacterium]|nr:N-6 DNA methylase [Tepidisphaeraceae bacterium]
MRWVLISDMRVVRLYSVESKGEFEEIDLEQCVDVTGQTTAQFRRLWFLLNHEYLIAAHEQSQVALLFDKSAGRQLEIRESFYEVYYKIRLDLFDAIKNAATVLSSRPSRDDLLQATQRLLDRLLFIYYCEDHPQRLIQDGTIARVTDAAWNLPGGSSTKVYANLKLFFREIDAGSPPGSRLNVTGYNGELFKEHAIIDYIDLPDELHARVYLATDPRGEPRRIQGVWGLHEYDFWSELNEHLLGHIFEESLSDLHDLGADEERSLAEKLRERKRSGIFYTTSILSDFLSASAMSAVLDEVAPIADEEAALTDSLRQRLNTLVSLRIVDFACGSGAFLVSAYQQLLQEFWHLRESLDVLMSRAGTAPDLFQSVQSINKATLLRDCLAGADLFPQAVEIAKLALWLRSAKKGEKVPDLSTSLVAADSLDVANIFELLHATPGSFDLVIGNPPWGGEVTKARRTEAALALGLEPDVDWDSWELFVALGIRALKDGGRLALVLPDSFLYPEKAAIRRLLFATSTIEKVHNLGPDWFGKRVRMGTVLLQARRGQALLHHDAICAIVAGDLRQKAIRGEVPLTQIEERRKRLIPLSRSAASETAEIELFRGIRDDRIMEAMVGRSCRVDQLCLRGRGEEINKSGILWECPGCLAPTTPGEKRKGGGYEDKACPSCGHTLRQAHVTLVRLVDAVPSSNGQSVPFIDGDDIRRRYQRVQPNKWLRLGLSGFRYKPAFLYTPPKILLRQAGVGLFATLDITGARCPQSVYVYRIKPQYLAQGYRHEYVLGAFLSRSMAYYVFKRFGEIDPAKAHAKLTHERISTLPIPSVQFSDREQKRLHDTIVTSVERLLAGTSIIGGEDDRAVENALRRLWAISPEDGAYINGEFYDLPESQAIRELFPNRGARPDEQIISPTE